MHLNHPRSFTSELVFKNMDLDFFINGYRVLLFDGALSPSAVDIQVGFIFYPAL
jgi:hypothetical protein